MSRKTPAADESPNVALRIARRRERDSKELRELIEKAGLTQLEAAKALGKSLRIVQYWTGGMQEVPRMAVLAMRWIVEHRADEMLEKLAAKQQRKL